MSASGQASLLGLVSSFLGDNDSLPTPSTATQPNALTDSNVLNDASSEGETQYQDPCVKLVIFSKDRPWQLQELFRSMRLDDCVSDDVHITVSLELLVHITEQYQTAYDEVISSVESILESIPNITLTCHKEDPADTSSFQSLFESMITDEVDPSYWMFLTDDCLLLVSLGEVLQTATSAFLSNAQVKCFCSRLHPGITWTQTRSLPSPPPRAFLRYLPGRTLHSDGVYVYPLECGELDWAYPWDLSGGIYSHSLVQTVFEKLQGTHFLSHPNRMEIAGNQAIAPLINSHFLAAVPTRPMLVIIAINRVQDVCQAPLACDDTDASALSPEALLPFYDQKKHLDLARYKAPHFNSSHVGDLYLLPDCEADNITKHQSTTEEREEGRPALSVLIPVHTGPPQAAALAIRSIVMQPVEECSEHHDDGSPQLFLSPMQIVIVEDRCPDGSIDAMAEAIQAIAAEHLCIRVTTSDYRQGEMATPTVTNSACDSSLDSIEVFVDIISSPKPGVAATLNHGLSYCKSDLVARMDADDIAEPGRLGAQVAALRYQSDLDVLGSSVLLFREDAVITADSDERQKPNLVRVPTDTLPYTSLPTPQHDLIMNVVTSLHPTDSGVTAWAMLFSCSIAHPSIVYRKKAISEAGGYNEDYSAAEDYELWLRMTTQKCSSLASIPKIGLWHRKHRSRSERTSKQSGEALQASVVAMKVLVKEPDWTTGTRLETAASVLRKPDTATCLDEVNEAADLLISIEAAFMRHHGKALSPREVALINKDCNGRIGELATLAVQRSLVDPADVNNSVAWKVWCERCPDLTMNRVALLCHSYRGN